MRGSVEHLPHWLRVGGRRFCAACAGAAGPSPGPPTHLHTYTPTHLHTYIYIHTYTHLHTHTHTHTYTHTRTHTHTHTQTQPPPSAHTYSLLKHAQLEACEERASACEAASSACRSGCGLEDLEIALPVRAAGGGAVADVLTEETVPIATALTVWVHVCVQVSHSSITFNADRTIETLVYSTK